jgi:hypothetical protein
MEIDHVKSRKDQSAACSVEVGRTSAWTLVPCLSERQDQRYKNSSGSGTPSPMFWGTGRD